MMRFLSFASFVLITACTAADGTKSVSDLTADRAPTVWDFEANAADLRAASCPDGTAFERAETMALKVAAVDRGPTFAHDEHVRGMTLSGVWHLTSRNDEFGGISGLDVLRSGSLLAVTDDGKFVWIGIDPETGAPDGIASIADMKNAQGRAYPRKRLADSEDLVFHDGLALVSFEQDHRVSAFDLEGCGAAAREALIADLGRVVDGAVLEPNRGPEALALLGSKLSVGYEARTVGGSPIGDVQTDGTLTNVRRTDQPNFFLLTGMDHTEGLTAKVFRAFDPVRGARGIVTVHRDEEEIAVAHLVEQLPRDNYEAIAIGPAPDGRTRIWVMSDDNFNPEQRTLLLAFDLFIG